MSERSLLDCKNEKQIIALPRDNFEVKDFSILTDGFNVWLGEQHWGENPTQKIRIPKPIFDALIRKYTEPQLVRGKPNGR